jgi:uncharacterized membrane protein
MMKVSISMKRPPLHVRSYGHLSSVGKPRSSFNSSNSGRSPGKIYTGVVLGVAGLVTVVGLWTLKKWSLWLTIVVSVLNILSAAPGFVFAPDPGLLASAIVTVVGFALIIVLVILPTSRRGFTQRS